MPLMETHRAFDLPFGCRRNVRDENVHHAPLCPVKAQEAIDILGNRVPDAGGIGVSRYPGELRYLSTHRADATSGYGGAEDEVEQQKKVLTRMTRMGHGSSQPSAISFYVPCFAEG